MARARRRKDRESDRRHDTTPGPVREHWRSDGQAKRRFPSAEDANRSSLRLRLEEGADLQPYRCRFCGGWHLGNRTGR